jgi:hypothetical protein
MSFSISYHIFLNLSITLFIGNLIRKKRGISLQNNSWEENIKPFALVYLPISLGYAFIVNEMPLTGITINPIYDTNSASSLGPQSISRDGIFALLIIIVSILINLFVWLYCLVIIINYYKKRRSFREKNKSKP